MKRHGARLAVRYLAAAAGALLALSVTGLLAAPLGGVFFVIPLAAITVISLAFGIGAGLATMLLITLGFIAGFPLQSSGWPLVNVSAVSRLVSSSSPPWSSA
ncbi:MAG: hypothetical protein ACOX6T_27605 [Myxococcales bacterium]|jgi:hypothetical protein